MEIGSGVLRAFTCDDLRAFPGLDMLIDIAVLEKRFDEGAALKQELRRTKRRGWEADKAVAVLKRVELVLGPPRFDVATDRSVLGSMTIASRDLDCLKVEVENVLALDPLETAWWLNDRPVTIRGKWSFPAEAMLDKIRN